MLKDPFKRTKIVATIGPASAAPKMLEDLYIAGVDMFRLNFAHGTHAQHGDVAKVVRHLSDKHGRAAAVLADIQGPKIRVGTLPADGLPFVRGQQVSFEYGADYEATGTVPVQHDVSKYIKKGERIFLRDGHVQIEVEKIQKTLITGTVIGPGVVFSNQGMNLPDTDLGGEILTKKDIADIEYAVSQNVDYIGYSFVQTAADVHALRERLKRLGSEAQIISKIETAAAIENLDDIVKATDVIMVARGDLAIETKPEAVPAMQRRMIRLGRTYDKPVIVATQMLESMIQSQQPTRAEVSDVATAVLEGADAVMLSGESAVGLFPVEAVKMMGRVILQTQQEEETASAQLPHAGTNQKRNAVSAAAVVLAQQLPARALVAETSSGQTARNIAAYRPAQPIIVVTDHERVYFQSALVWGTRPYLVANMAGATDALLKKLRAVGIVDKGDAVVVASGHTPGLTGGTDMVQIKIVD